MEIVFKFQHFGYVVWEYVHYVFQRYNYSLFHVLHMSLFCMTLSWIWNVWILCSILNFQYITNALNFLCEYLFIALHTFFESIASIRRTRKEKKHCSYKRRQAYVQYIVAYNKGLRRLSISLEKCLSVDEISIQTLLI